MVVDHLKPVRERLAQTLPKMLSDAVDTLLAAQPAAGSDLKTAQAASKAAIANLQALMKLTEWVAAQESADARHEETRAMLATAHARLAPLLAEDEVEGDE